MKNMVEESIRQLRTLPNACEEDVELIVKILSEMKDSPTVVQLGAGSGTLTMAILGVRPKSKYVVIDHNIANAHWEQAALDNCGWSGDREVLIGDSQKIGKTYKGKIDFLLIDCGHSYKEVLGDLKEWSGKVTKVIMLHDYVETKEAPFTYPGVKKAADEFFKREPDYIMGWSAAWIMDKPKKRSKK